VPRSPRRLAVIGTATAVLALTSPALHAGAAEPVLAPVQLVTIDTPTRADKDELITLGLDLTEHAGHDYVEAVLHTGADADVLREAGFTWDVRIPDLVQRESEINTANRAYAAATEVSPLPSGRDTYRSLQDYVGEMAALAATYPDLVRSITLPHTSLEGRPVQGVEIGRDVRAPEDGRPVFVMLGLHHAREWPSGELSMEFAHDLAQNYGRDQRITALLDASRVIVVPVVNVDGFDRSFTSGQAIDLREVDGGDTVSILATPGNAYKRKNCRMPDGLDPLTAGCVAAASPGGFGIGVDPNRNYGALWGGPGAAAEYPDPTYRGAGPFSEPETQNVRALVSSRQVTTLITNHTFSNLVLRPNGVNPTTVGPDGRPVGDAHDEDALKALGAQMTAQNGYRNIHGWELYDTTGTTEDWSYNATGGFGYTFEIGPDEFHPPFPAVVDEYLGAGEFAGKGNREAFLVALENTVNTANHSVITGKAPAGATLRLTKRVVTPTWDPQEKVDDTLATSMVVGPDGRYTWHTNPSTNPLSLERRYQVLAEEPVRSQSFPGGPTAVGQQVDHEFAVAETGIDLLRVDLDWPTPDDLDLEVYARASDGTLTRVGSSGNFVGEKEQALVQNPQPGTYVLRVVNYASVAPSYTVTAALFDAVETTVPQQLIENWTLSCEKDGRVLERVPVVVDRGQQVKADLRTCTRRWTTG
jgi:hypothetical protein